MKCNADLIYTFNSLSNKDRFVNSGICIVGKAATGNTYLEQINPHFSTLTTPPDRKKRIRHREIMEFDYYYKTHDSVYSTDIPLSSLKLFFDLN